ncbi:hypothetical protein GQX74_008580 [Glossina fuscipes]|nr:hypothetical protein GQX74_008580 [Glossina fuscipes]
MCNCELLTNAAIPKQDVSWQYFTCQFAGVFNQQHSADLGSEQAEQNMTMDLTLNDSRANDDDYEETQRRQQDFVSVGAIAICPLHVAPIFEAFESKRVEDLVNKVGDSNSEFEPLSPMKRCSSLKAAGLKLEEGIITNDTKLGKQKSQKFPTPLTVGEIHKMNKNEYEMLKMN